MLGRLKRFFAGQSITADDTLKSINAVADAIDRESRLDVAPPLWMRQTESGRVFGRRHDTWSWWKFTTSASPYNCTQQVRSSGAWANGPISLTGKCYEAQGKPIPAGTIVRGQLLADGTVQAHYQCCGGQICFTVKACDGTGRNGATVTVTQSGTTVGTCTTDSSGHCCVAVSSAATYSYSIADTSARFAVATGTVSFPGSGTTNVTVNLAGATGYTCVAACALPVANTLHGSNKWGSYTLNFVSGTGWTGTQTIAFTGRAATVVASDGTCGCLGTALNKSVVIIYQLIPGVHNNVIMCYSTDTSGTCTTVVGNKVVVANTVNGTTGNACTSQGCSQTGPTQSETLACPTSFNDLWTCTANDPFYSAGHVFLNNDTFTYTE